MYEIRRNNKRMTMRVRNMRGDRHMRETKWNEERRKKTEIIQDGG